MKAFASSVRGREEFLWTLVFKSGWVWCFAMRSLFAGPRALPASAQFSRAGPPGKPQAPASERSRGTAWNAACVGALKREPKDFRPNPVSLIHLSHSSPRTAALPRAQNPLTP